MRIDALEPRIALSAAAMDLIGLTELRAHPFYSQFDGSGQTVVVIDQPIDWTSPFLAERRVTDIDVLGTSGPITGETHGTFVASIVGASNSQIGVAPGAGIIGVLSDGTEPPIGTNPNEVWRLNENDIDHLLDWVLANHEQFNIVAVNMSLGDSRFYTNAGQVAQRPLNDEIAALEAAGVAVVTSAGNDYHENQTRNASYPAVVSTFAVGAVYAANVGPQVALGDFTTGPDRIAAFSQRAAADEGNVLFAPGAAVRGVQQGSQQGLGSGTSFASPYVAAAVAILQQAALEIVGSRLPVEQIAQLLIDTSDTIIDGDDEDDDVENTGAAFPRINILAAVEALDEMFSEAGLLVRGGGSLDQPIEHDEKARAPAGRASAQSNAMARSKTTRSS
ncbi:MAG: S8 family serine peptidase [Phycisphaerales bacterium]